MLCEVRLGLSGIVQKLQVFDITKIVVLLKRSFLYFEGIKLADINNKCVFFWFFCPVMVKL